MFSQHACQQALNKYNLNHSVGHVWRYLYTEVEISLTLCLKLTYVYTMFEDIFSACLNTCVHHCWWYVYMYMHTPCLDVCLNYVDKVKDFTPRVNKCIHYVWRYVNIMVKNMFVSYLKKCCIMFKDMFTQCWKTKLHHATRHFSTNLRTVVPWSLIFLKCWHASPLCSTVCWIWHFLKVSLLIRFYCWNKTWRLMIGGEQSRLDNNKLHYY